MHSEVCGAGPTLSPWTPAGPPGSERRAGRSSRPPRAPHLRSTLENQPPWGWAAGTPGRVRLPAPLRGASSPSAVRPATAFAPFPFTHPSLSRALAGALRGRGVCAACADGQGRGHRPFSCARLSPSLRPASRPAFWSLRRHTHAFATASRRLAPGKRPRRRGRLLRVSREMFLSFVFPLKRPIRRLRSCGRLEAGRPDSPICRSSRFCTALFCESALPLVGPADISTFPPLLGSEGLLPEETVPHTCLQVLRPRRGWGEDRVGNGVRVG